MPESQSPYPSAPPAKAAELADWLAEYAYQAEIGPDADKLDASAAMLREQSARLAKVEALCERWGKLRVAYGLADKFAQPEEYHELRAALSNAKTP